MQMKTGHREAIIALLSEKKNTAWATIINPFVTTQQSKPMVFKERELIWMNQFSETAF